VTNVPGVEWIGRGKAVWNGFLRKSAVTVKAAQFLAVVISVHPQSSPRLTAGHFYINDFFS